MMRFEPTVKIYVDEYVNLKQRSDVSNFLIGIVGIVTKIRIKKQETGTFESD